MVELFKSATAAAAGTSDVTSSNEQWAIADLERNFVAAAHNPALLIESFVDACERIRLQYEELWTPDADLINAVLRKPDVPFAIEGQNLVAIEGHAAPVPLPPAPVSIAQTALDVYAGSLARAEQLLGEGRPREAVQELLWVLETLATAFRGIETSSGTVAGKYFNQIARDLRAKNPGTTLERILEWLANLHGYLSSPTGGGVRHWVGSRYRDASNG